MATFDDWLDTEDPNDPFSTKITKGAYRFGRPLYNMLGSSPGSPLIEGENPPETGRPAYEPPSTEGMFSEAPHGIGPPAPEGYTPPRDVDAEMAAYLRKATEAPPSERIYEEYISRKPHEEQYRKGGFWRSLGGALAGLGGRQDIAHMITHPGMERAYSDWETEGKYVGRRASAADAARNRSLMMEKFGIEQEDKKRKEAIQSQRDTQLAIHQQEVDKRNEEREARIAQREADAADYRARTERRAEDTARRAEAREGRAERREIEAGETARRKELEGTYKGRTTAFEEEEKNVEKRVTEEFLADPNNEEHIDRKTGRLSPEAKQAIAAEVTKRRRKMETRRPMAYELDPHDVEAPELPPIGKRPEETEEEKPWYKRMPDWYTKRRF